MIENSVTDQLQLEITDDVAPQITGLAEAFSLVESDTTAKANYLSGVTAQDEIDGDLSDKITVDDSEVKYGTPGEYTAAIYVTMQLEMKIGNQLQ